MDTAQTTALLDQDGDPLPDTLPAWLEGQRASRGMGPTEWVRYVATATKSHPRTVERWRAGSKHPDAAVCRALRIVLSGPAEAEAMRCLAGALRALQARTSEQGGGGAGRQPGQVAALSQPSPSPPPPVSPDPDLWAAAEEIAREDDTLTADDVPAIFEALKRRQA